MLAVERRRRAIRVDVFHLAMPPDIAAFLDVDVVAGAAENDDLVLTELPRVFSSASSTFFFSGTIAPRR